MPSWVEYVTRSATTPGSTSKLPCCWGFSAGSGSGTCSVCWICLRSRSGLVRPPASNNRIETRSILEHQLNRKLKLALAAARAAERVRGVLEDRCVQHPECLGSELHV